MALAFILLIFNRKGTYAKLLRRLSTPACIALLALTSACSQPSKTPLTASRQQLSLISDSVLIFYNGRIAPLSTYATDFTLKIAGSRTWRGLSAEQVLIGWLCFPDRWQDEKMLKIKGDLPENAGVDADGNRCSILDLFEDDGRYKLEKFFGPKTPKAVSELNDRAQLIVMLTSGEEVRLFPWRDAAENVRWLSPSDRLPREMSEQQRTFVRNFVSILRTAIENDDAELIGKLTSSLATMQRRALADHAPSAWRLSLESAVNAIAPTTWLARLTHALGHAMQIIWLRRTDLLSRRKVRLAAVAVLATFGILQLANLIARGLIAMQLPLATGYETMLVLALGITVVAFAARRVAFAIVPTSLLLTGFALLVADLGLNNPSITPLMPVLHSPWLSIHVATVMMSYSLLTLTALNSLAALAMRRNTQRSVDLGLALLYPAVALLSVGIFVGAVWANESWGNYWSWDPKEVWALITLLVYIVPLHANLIPTLKTPRNFHIFTALAFLTVLMTYFGVNHLLGGMHSYGAQ